MVYVRAICLSSWVLLYGGRGGGQIPLFPMVHYFTLCKFQKMSKEQLILHWSLWDAINSLRQAGLLTSYLPSVELGASLRGEGGGEITLFPMVHYFTLWKFQKMPEEQLILHWSPWSAINSVRQAGLHTSYMLSVELGASLRGEGGGGGYWFSPNKTLVQRNYAVASVLE